MKTPKVKKEFVLVKLADLKPHPKNPKDHDIEAIKSSIMHNGALDPIEVDEKNVILAGHGRWEAEIELGIEEDHVIRYTGLTDEQKEDYVLRANTTTMSRGFLDDKLKLFGKERLSGTGFFSSTDMDRIFGATEDLEDDFNPDKEYGSIKKPETKPGDLYILGRHRLLCGDATKQSDYERVLDGKKADLIFTDPPYNVAYQGTRHGGIKNDDMEDSEFVVFTEAFMGCFAESLKKGGVFYICSGYSSYPVFRYAIERAKMTFSCPIVWVKNHAALGWGDYQKQHELILKGDKKGRQKRVYAEQVLYGWNGGKHYFVDDRTEADVWDFRKRAGTTMVHPTQKPVALVNKALKNSSKRGELVLDPFGGSGSTLIAAERTDRRAALLELDPKYCDVIVRRWENATGQAAQLFEA